MRDAINPAAENGWATAREQLKSGGVVYQYHSIHCVETQSPGLLARLPFSLKLLLENTLRNYDNLNVTQKHLDPFLNWDGTGGHSELSYMPGRIILQDFTGVPVVADLAAMRSSYAEKGGDPAQIGRAHV